MDIHFEGQSTAHIFVIENSVMFLNIFQNYFRKDLFDAKSAEM